jgi:hypothetical protein
MNKNMIDLLIQEIKLKITKELYSYLVKILSQ